MTELNIPSETDFSLPAVDCSDSQQRVDRR